MNAPWTRPPVAKTALECWHVLLSAQQAHTDLTAAGKPLPETEVLGAIEERVEQAWAALDAYIQIAMPGLNLDKLGLIA